MWKLATGLAGMGALAVSLGVPRTVPSGAPRPAPPWQNTSWLNSDRPLTVESLRGQVILLNFWVFTCGNCTRTLPSLVRFDSLYREAGLTIIGIHTPEFPPHSGEHDKANVARALERYHVTWPNAQDNDNATWNLYGIRYWPSFVLIDRKGQIRYEGYGEFHVGDGTDREWERRIRTLLDEGAPIRISHTSRNGIAALQVEPAQGTRINARLAPAVEWADGRALRMDRGRVSSDSAYFIEPAWAPLEGVSTDGAVVRVSYCADGEKVCRTGVFPVPRRAT